MRPVAIVTGGKRGIGRGIALALAAAGFDLGLIDLDADLGPVDELTYFGGRVEYATCDLSDIKQHAAAIDTLREKFGSFQVLVNNAGIGSVERGAFSGLTAENFDKVLNTNLRGTVFFTQSILPLLKGPRAAVVNITSVSAAMTSPERLDYCISKAALSAFTQGLAVDLASKGIAVFEVRPGIIETGMTVGVKTKYDDAIADGLVPQGRWGKPDDVGSIVAALSSGAFGYASGTIINADGGLSIARL